MKRLLLLCAAAFIYIISFAQKINASGYIVNNAGDSIHGFLQEEVKSEIVKQIKFSSQKDATGNVFAPSDLKSFAYDNGNIYKSISFKSTLNEVPESKNYFAKQLVSGEFDLFAYVEDEATYFVILNIDSTYFLYNSTYTALGTEKTTGNFYQSVIHLGAYCDKMKSTDWVVYNEKTVAKFIAELNQCMAPEKASTIYYHSPKIRYAPFAYIGGFPGKENQVTAEGGVAISSPQISKKAFLRIGVHYSNTITTEERLSGGNIKYLRDTRDVFTSIPITFQFNFTSGIVQPFVDFGVSFAKHTKTIYPTHYNPLIEDTKYGLAGMAGFGVEGHITKWLFINAEWTFEEMPQNEMTFQFPTFGIACRF